MAARVETPGVLQAPVPPLSGPASYSGDKKAQQVFRVGEGDSNLVLVWFPGSDQAADNELVRRFVNALHDVPELNLTVRAVPYSQGQEVIGAESAQTGKKVLVGGHSAGGGAAFRASHKMPGKVAGLVTINGSTVGVGVPGVPCLHIVGQNDETQQAGTASAAFNAAGPELMVASKSLDAENTLLVCREGDHSIRYRKKSDGDRDGASTSESTRTMNLQVATHFKQWAADLSLL